jgi:hypothetical protein
MGKFSPTANLNYQVVPGALVGVNEGVVFSAPAYFNGSVYYVSSADRVKSFALSAARLSPIVTDVSATSYAYPGATPSISANGLANAILWAVENSAVSGCVLHAYDAGMLSNEIYNSTQAPNNRDAINGGDNKFIVPTVTAGKVFVATTTGIAVFGSLP